MQMKKYLLWLFGITMMLTACNQNNPEKYYNPDAGRYIDKAPARMPAASDKMRMIYCYCFKPNGDKIKFW